MHSTLQATMTRLNELLAVLALSVALLPMGVTAAPADTLDMPTPEATVEAELRSALTSDAVEEQERAARRIREYAHTARYSESLFTDLVTPLHDIVADGETEAVRLAAVAALSAIGTDVAMLGLQVEKDTFTSERVKKATEATLTRYAAKYTDDTRRSQLGE